MKLVNLRNYEDLNWTGNFQFTKEIFYFQKSKIPHILIWNKDIDAVMVLNLTTGKCIELSSVLEECYEGFSGLLKDDDEDFFGVFFTEEKLNI